MSDTDVLGLEAALRELREGLRRMELRLDQRDAATQSTIQTLTRQMVQMEASFEGRFAKLELRLTTLAQHMETRFDRIETMLAEIRRERR
jgi:hypothetical protein